MKGKNPPTTDEIYLEYWQLMRPLQLLRADPNYNNNNNNNNKSNNNKSNNNNKVFCEFMRDRRLYKMHVLVDRVVLLP